MNNLDNLFNLFDRSENKSKKGERGGNRVLEQYPPKRLQRLVRLFNPLSSLVFLKVTLGDFPDKG
jgi:hypothetical protein